MTDSKKTPVNFEKSLKDLEDVVAAMENKQLTLDEALAQFEKGVTLSKSCQEALSKAELKIETITQSQQKNS